MQRFNEFPFEMLEDLNIQGQCKAWRIPSPKNLTWWPWPLTLKINRVSDSLKDWACTKFGQNTLKDVDSRVFTRMLRKDRRTEGSATISLRNFVGEGIKNFCDWLTNGRMEMINSFGEFECVSQWVLCI